MSGAELRFFGRSKRESKQDGRTVETAFRLPPIGNASAIAIEFQLLERMFGKQGEDWRQHDRIRSKTSAGREVEKFILGTPDGRRVVYFDITDILGSPDPEPVQEIMDAVMRRQKDRFVTISLAEGPLMMLFKIFEDVGPELRTKNFDPETVANEIIKTLTTRELGTDVDFPLTLSVANWVNVMSTARIVQVPNLLGQELTNDLIACIEGALKNIGPGV